MPGTKLRYGVGGGGGPEGSQTGGGGGLEGSQRAGGLQSVQRAGEGDGSLGSSEGRRAIDYR